jgi:hypothetical protein
MTTEISELTINDILNKQKETIKAYLKHKLPIIAQNANTCMQMVLPGFVYLKLYKLQTSRHKN